MQTVSTKLTSLEMHNLLLVHADKQIPMVI